MLVRLADPEIRIRELCFKAIAANNPEELDKVLFELRTTLHEQVEHLKEVVEEHRHRIAKQPVV